MAEKAIVVFARSKSSVKSEEGLEVMPDKSIDELVIDDYDSLILPGAMHIREAIEDDEVIDFIRKFDGKVIGAISIAPIMLVRAGMLKGKLFMEIGRASCSERV